MLAWTLSKTSENMPLKNYTTKCPALQSIGEIQAMLTKRGATGILFEYDPAGSGRLEALCFRINMSGKMVGFRLPSNWRRAQEALIQQDIKRARNDQEYVYRVAWRVLKDWVDAQMSILDLELVEMPQIFLPYAIGANDKTLYENVMNDSGFLLGNGS